jgi:hypothetical protein
MVMRNHSIYLAFGLKVVTNAINFDNHTVT